MTEEQWASLLQTGFAACESAGVPLEPEQQEILRQILLTWQEQAKVDGSIALTANPLDELTPEQRQTFLQYVVQEGRNNNAWKIKLLNDWLHNRDSGPVQFIRKCYGVQWLERIQPFHLAVYTETKFLPVKVGDRLEVCNRLWEWVPEATEGDEWYPCTVIRVYEATDNNRCYRSCSVRLENGVEYDIPGLYDWNQSNWRWQQS